MILPAPVVWKPSPNFGAMVRGTRGRAGHRIRGWVDHRIVGSLGSADNKFASVTTASSHFGIGRVNGRLEIHQYVDLADTAWTNGDVREPSWPVVRELGVANPNLYTVTVEHEDGGSAGRGVVQPDTWAASIALTKLCVSGDLAAIRAAGIRIGDRPGKTAQQLVADLAAIPKTELGFIDHHQIAGPNKPYCWRRWLDDPGFVAGLPSRRDQLLAALRGVPDTAQEDDMIDPKRHKPVASVVFKGGAVYKDPDRRTGILSDKLPAGTRVGVYALPRVTTEPSGKAALVACLFDTQSGDAENLVLGWPGVDQIDWESWILLPLPSDDRAREAAHRAAAAVVAAAAAEAARFPAPS